MASPRSIMPPRHGPARRRIALAASMLALGVGFPSLGRAAPDPAPDDLGDWVLAPAKDGKGCFITRVYDRTGGTTLLLGIDTDGANHLSVLNANWSIRPKERLKLDFRVSAGSYAKHFAIGIASNGKQGFVTSFEPKFPSYFATSNLLSIARGDVPVERLNLDGSGAAVKALRTCVEAQRRKPRGAATDKARGSDIPRDPFAPSSTRKDRK